MLVTPAYLEKLRAAQLELSVTLDESVTGKFRDVLIMRSDMDGADAMVTRHPVDECDYFTCDTDDESDLGQAPNTGGWQFFSSVYFNTVAFGNSIELYT